MNHEHGHGQLIRWATRYDALVALALAGRGGRFRAGLAELLAPAPGKRVLDVGCGTGTLALALAPRLAPGGVVVGVDASPEMVLRAQGKARRRALPVTFQHATAQNLPFPDSSFDAGICTLMLHHLPHSDRSTTVRELVRVLRPGGRLVLADFRPPAGAISRRLSGRLLGPAMAASDLHAVVELARASRLADVRLDRTAVPWLGVVHGHKP